MIQTPEHDSFQVSALWDKLESMESENRFAGKPYPKGMARFPFRLTGQGFFPGGDGLWREDSQLAAASCGRVLKRGIVFLGNDFGTLKTFQSYRKSGYENVVTWRCLKRRIRSAQLPTETMFFTNAVLGLREAGKADETKDWRSMPGFPEFCRRFLNFQLQFLNPRLLVVLGPKAEESYCALNPRLPMTRTIFSRHPRGDTSPFVPWQEEAARLIEGWRAAQKEFPQ